MIIECSECRKTYSIVRDEIAAIVAQGKIAAVAISLLNMAELFY